jgi:hypothetical protein
MSKLLPLAALWGTAIVATPASGLAFRTTIVADDGSL